MSVKEIVQKAISYQNEISTAEQLVKLDAEPYVKWAIGYLTKDRIFQGEISDQVLSELAKVFCTLDESVISSIVSAVNNPS